jgi:16S rRNA (guanine(966)-N(2))-methyltransferase RsmD
VRPTTDKIRQSIFNILAHETPGARILDLFCGSGALGIEALSRGAESVMFVDESKKSLQALEKNLTDLNLAAETVLLDWKAALGQLTERNLSFDLIFADPPYHQVKIETICKSLVSGPGSALLAPDGIFIMESEAEAKVGKALRLLKERKFGQTKVGFYTHASENSQ